MPLMGRSDALRCATTLSVGKPSEWVASGMAYWPENTLRGVMTHIVPQRVLAGALRPYCVARRTSAQYRRLRSKLSAPIIAMAHLLARLVSIDREVVEHKIVLPNLALPAGPSLNLAFPKG